MPRYRLNKPSSCSGCPLQFIGNGFSEPDGTGANGVLAMGEALGHHEAFDGLPFRPQAEAGSLLNRAFGMAGMRRESFVIFNIIACQPPGNELSGASYEAAAIAHCEVHRRRVIEQFRPKAILALGAVALRTLTGMSGGRLNLEHLRGYSLDSTFSVMREYSSNICGDDYYSVEEKGSQTGEYSQQPDSRQEHQRVQQSCAIPVIGTYHPSHVKRGKWPLLPVIVKDIRFAVDVAQNGPPDISHLQYVVDGNEGNLEEMRDELRANPDIVLSTDAETNYSELIERSEFETPEIVIYTGQMRQQITQVNLSIEEGTALVVDATPSKMSLVAEIHAIDCVKTGHNLLLFDKPVYEDNGIPMYGPLEDTMWCLRGDTKVALWSGKMRRIDTIVENQEFHLVKGLNKAGRIVPISITDWHKKVVVNQIWLRIKTDANRYPIICTPDHKIMVRGKGWQRSEFVVPGDVVYVPQRGSDSLIHGSLLGDGYLHKPSRMLNLRHGLDQIDYLRAKAEHLGAAIYPVKGKCEAIAGAVVSRSWHSKFYRPDGSRIFVEPPSLAALAVWYMDDGCITVNKRKGKVSSNPRVIFAIDRFAVQFADVLSYFKREFGGDGVAIHQKAGEPKRLCLSKTAVASFFRSIAPFVHPSMSYKLPAAYKGQYNGWLSENVSQRAIVEIAAPVKWGGKIRNVRYCISVDHASHGFFSAGGFVHNCFHHLFPDLPGSIGRMSGTSDDYSEAGSVANLQYVANFAGFPIPWKHLSSADPGWYGGCDADAGLRAFWWTRGELEKLGLLDSYYSMTLALMPILEKMCRRGIPVNRQMLVDLHRELTGAINGIDTRIQSFIPREILPLHPKMRWTKAPKGVTVDVRKKQGDQAVVIPACPVVEIDVDLPAVVKKCCFRKRKVGKNPALYQKYAESSHARLDPKDGVLIAPNPDCPKCGGLGVIQLPARTARRWAAEMPFNAASSNQMFAYANWKGYRVPKNRKREVSMDEEVVTKLAKTYKDPVFGLCVDKRGFVKLATTYCIGWVPASDERVHCQVGPYPATGQLSGRNPNPQNVPNLSKISNPEKLGYATKFRQALHAEPGHLIVECDFRSFHVQTLGFEAGDPIYIGLGKTDIHSFFAVCGLLRVETRDSLLKPAWKNLSLGRADLELGQRLRWYRKNYKLKNGDSFDLLRNKQAKVAILAYGLGQQSGSLYRGNEDSFSSEREAEELIRSMNRIFEKESAYRDSKPLTVRPNGYKIINRYGFIRWFFGVQKLNRKKACWEHGDDWEAAIAFDVQASAHGHLRECVKLNEYAGFNERYQFDNTVHDSLRFHCPEDLVEELVHQVKPLMEHESKVMLMPWDDMRGLSIEVEIKVGRDWGPGMREVA